MPQTIYIRDVDDEVAAALAAAAERESVSLSSLLRRHLAQIAHDTTRTTQSGLRLDLSYPQAPRLIWNGSKIDELRLYGPDGAKAVLNAWGTGGGRNMSEQLHRAKRLAGDHVNKARVLGTEELGVDIVKLLEDAGWEVFPG